MNRIRTFFLRILLKIAWSVGGRSDGVDGLPRLRGEALGPVLDRMRPGDIVLLGNNGLLTHIAVHEGQGALVHAMATEKTMRGWFGSIWDAIKRVVGVDETKVGVVREPLVAFVDRYERDTFAVLRVEVSPEAMTRGLERIGGLVGKPYDYGFRADNEAWYCTEIVAEFLAVTLGDEAPKLVSKRVTVPLLLDEEVIEPVAVLDVPGLVRVAANRAALAHYATQLEGADLID